MIKVYFLILIGISFLINGIVKGQNIDEPLYYLNSNQIDLKKVYLNTLRLDSIDVQKQTNSGEVYLYTKGRKFSYYRLSDVVSRFTDFDVTHDSILFKINGKLIEDTTSIIIDDTYFIYVNTDKLNNVKYIPKQFYKLIIVNIDLETKEREPVIYIRGNNDILNKLKNK